MDGHLKHAKTIQGKCISSQLPTVCAFQTAQAGQVEKGTCGFCCRLVYIYTVHVVVLVLGETVDSSRIKDIELFHTGVAELKCGKLHGFGSPYNSFEQK